jgi:hypothetical protein
VADQTLKIDSGSHERVAYDLFRWLTYPQKTGETHDAMVDRSLALYGRCLKAVEGNPTDISDVKLT